MDNGSVDIHPKVFEELAKALGHRSYNPYLDERYIREATSRLRRYNREAQNRYNDIPSGFVR